MSLSIWIFKAIRSKDNFIAIFDDSLACDIDMKLGLIGIMNSQLMAVELEDTVMTIIDEDSRFCNSCSDSTVLEVF